MPRRLRLRKMSLSCGDCGRTFKRKWLWQRHMETIHNFNAKFQCTIASCGTIFKRKDVRDRHEQCQHGVKKAQCTNCADFIRKDGLKEHQNGSKCRSRTSMRRRAAALSPDSRSNATTLPCFEGNQTPETERCASDRSSCAGTISSFDSTPYAIPQTLVPQSPPDLSVLSSGNSSFSSLDDSMTYLNSTESASGLQRSFSTTASSHEPSAEPMSFWNELSPLQRELGMAQTSFQQGLERGEDDWSLFGHDHTTSNVPHLPSANAPAVYAYDMPVASSGRMHEALSPSLDMHTIPGHSAVIEPFELIDFQQVHELDTYSGTAVDSPMGRYDSAARARASSFANTGEIDIGAASMTCSAFHPSPLPKPIEKVDNLRRATSSLRQTGAQEISNERSEAEFNSRCDCLRTSTHTPATTSGTTYIRDWNLPPLRKRLNPYAKPPHDAETSVKRPETQWSVTESMPYRNSEENRVLNVKRIRQPDKRPARSGQRAEEDYRPGRVRCSHLLVRILRLQI